MADGVDYSKVMESKRKIVRFVATRLRVKAPLLTTGAPSNVTPLLVVIIITLPLMTLMLGANVVADYITTDLPVAPKRLIATVIQNTGIAPEIELTKQEGELFIICDI